MKTTAIRWTLIGGLALGLAAVALPSARRSAQLRVELTQLRTQQDELTALRGENRRLLAAQPAAAELESLRGDHAAVERMRAEIVSLQEQGLARLEALKAAQDPAVPLVRAKEWKNAGRATPPAAFETAIWAATGGDIDLLAQTLTFDPATREKAAALLDGLPAASRAEYRSPEWLLALLTAKDVPIDAVHVVAQRRVAPGEIMMRVGLHQADGAERSTTLLLREDAGEWRLVVPESAVDKYAAMLKGTAAVK